MSGPDRRDFLTAAALAAAAGVSSPAATAADESKKPLKFRLGMVTYNVAAKWNVPTILKVCKATGISPVELRTTHAHGVEPSLSKETAQGGTEAIRRCGR